VSALTPSYDSVSFRRTKDGAAVPGAGLRKKLRQAGARASRTWGTGTQTLGLETAWLNMPS